MSQSALTEQEVRALRDRVFEGPLPDASWENCKVHWMKPAETQWLKEQLKEEGK